MKILILDDDDTRHTLFKQNYSKHDLVHTYTADEAIDALKRGTYDVVFLDHDLGGKQMVDSWGEEPTGYTVAKWMAMNPERKPGQVYIHSLNPVGARNMHNILPGSKLAPGAWASKQ